MAMFLGHIAFMLELAAFVAGLALWHFGSEKPAGVLRAGAAIAMVGAVISALCTGYYMVRYSVQGDLDHAVAFHSGWMRSEMMEPGEMMKGGGMMGPGMMGGGVTGKRIEGAPERSEAPEPPGHEEHHPGQGQQ